jgi:hypothetical protein
MSVEISLCTYLSARNEHLAQTLPNWLRVRGIGEIVIFDWGSAPVKAWDVVKQYRDPRIVYLEGTGTERFHRSISRNVSIRASTGRILFHPDADVKVVGSSLPRLPGPCQFIRGGGRSGATGQMGKTVGTVLMWREQWEKVNGYNELMFGWGGEDLDFYKRLRGENMEEVRTTSAFFHLDHPDALRVLGQDNSIQQSVRDNGKISETVDWSDKSTYRQRAMTCIRRCNGKETIVTL